MKSCSAKPPTGPVPLADADADTHSRVGVPWCCRAAGAHERRQGRNALAPGAARASRSRAPRCTHRKLALASWRTRVHVRCRSKEHEAVPAPGRSDGSSMEKTPGPGPVIKRGSTLETRPFQHVRKSNQPCRGECSGGAARVGATLEEIHDIKTESWSMRVFSMHCDHFGPNMEPRGGVYARSVGLTNVFEPCGDLAGQ